MSSRILTTRVTGLDALAHDPRGVLANAEGG
jgi:DNA replication protein DnaT